MSLAFLELITLIETDKRENQINEITTLLNRSVFQVTLIYTEQ